jgi:hypothetical protein
MTLRWRKEPKETGLRAVGAGPYRSSSLWLDDESDYLATVSPDGGDWRKPFRGWYWVACTNQEKGIKLFNSYPRVYETEKEAKDAAKKYVLECMAAHNANKGT